jgi:peptidyl-prolyl cis-trans isomerase A (cyclophilin A)
MNADHAGTPSVFARFFALLGCAIVASSSQSAAPAAGVRATLETPLGAIEVEVFPHVAPLSACDFLYYVDAGLYESAAFYRVVRKDNDRGTPNIEVIQGGLQDEAEERAPIAHESTKQTGLQHVDGTLSLARGAVGTGSATAFFIVIGDQPALNYGGARNEDRQGFAAFGRVVRGMDIVKRIHRSSATALTDEPYLKGQLLSEPVPILKATRHGPAPQCAAAK